MHVCFLRHSLLYFVMTTKQTKTHTMEYYSALKEKGIRSYIGLAKKFTWVFHKMLWKNPNELFGQPNIITWMDLENIMLHEMNQAQKTNPV